MTISLARSILAADTLLSVTSPEDASLDGIYLIDDELVVVRGKPVAGSKLFVGRGHLGTTRVSHVPGAELQPFSVGGGGIRLLDSGDLLFEDIDWHDPEVPNFGEIPTGTAIVSVWVVIDIDYNGDAWMNTGVLAPPLWLQIILAKPDDTDGVDLVTYDLYDDQPDGSGSLVEFAPLMTEALFDATHVFKNSRRSATTVHPCKLFMHKTGDPDSLITGRFRVYALVAS